jgi:hypothetical protein
MPSLKNIATSFLLKIGLESYILPGVPKMPSLKNILTLCDLFEKLLTV